MTGAVVEMRTWVASGLRAGAVALAMVGAAWAQDAEPASDSEAADAATDPEAGATTPEADAPVETSDISEETPEDEPASADEDGSETAEEEAEADARSERVTTLREAETRSRRLKEDIFRSKATLALLEELLVESATLGSGVRVTHVNKLTKGYQVDAIDYFLDGRPLFSWEAEDGSALPKELELRNETVPPGDHLLQVVMRMRGRGGGVFGYVDRIEFTLQSTHEFEVRAGRVRTIEVIATTKGGKGARTYEERPRILYVEGGESVEAE